jgi:hypothetical protein
MTRNACVASVQASVGFASTDCLRLLDFLDLPVIVKAAVCLKKGLALARFFRHNITFGRRIEHRSIVLLLFLQKQNLYVSFSSISYVGFSLGRLTLFAAFLVLLLGGRDIAFISLSNDFFELGEESLTRHVRRFSL